MTPSFQTDTVTALQKALYDRQLNDVQQLSEVMDWPAHRALDAASEDLFEYSLADCFHFMDKDERTEWQSFTEQALLTMARQGYSLLDDSGLPQIMEENDEFLPIAIRVSQQCMLLSAEGNTIAHLALGALPLPHVAKSLIGAQVDLDAPNHAGQRPLEMMWANGPKAPALVAYWLDTTRVLLEGGADVHLKIGNGSSLEAFILEQAQANPHLDSWQREEITALVAAHPSIDSSLVRRPPRP